jgi:hypothetical protein
MQTQKFEYRGKHFEVPLFSREGGIEIMPVRDRSTFLPVPTDVPVMKSLNEIWDLKQFQIPRKPISLGILGDSLDRARFCRRGVAPRVLDMPIKFPGSHFRVPAEFVQFVSVIKKVADFESMINARCYDEYYCYMTLDHGYVEPGTLQREAPCHVDGFQGARWNPKVRNNHTYTVGDVIPTIYYVQPFATDHLDDTKHDFFWDFNRQVAETKSAHAWRPREFEITMMDCYCVHRGDRAPAPMHRTWLRLSFEVRKFDRLGNAHNPLFQYDWEMVPRDIEELGLVSYDPHADPSLSVFPWQHEDGTARTDGKKTQPNLMPPA